MRSDWTGPVNIGSDEMVTIDGLATMIMKIAKKKLSLEHIPGPLGVRGRNSDNTLIEKMLKWRPREALVRGLERTYPWVLGRVLAAKQRPLAS
jgi:nucleoside-diphosphate-sugar epimerase